MFFISEKKLEENILYPRIPINYFTQNGFEDNKIKRISFSPSIDKCLSALGYNCSNTIFYVYKPTISYEDLLKNKFIQIPNSSQVPDCEYTEEIWCTKPISLILIGKILCKNAKEGNKHAHKFNYGNNFSYIYDWNFEWI